MLYNECVSMLLNSVLGLISHLNPMTREMRFQQRAKYGGREGDVNNTAFRYKGERIGKRTPRRVHPSRLIPIRMYDESR